jgi:hypothetical protein
LLDNLVKVRGEEEETGKRGILTISSSSSPFLLFDVFADTLKC